MRGSPAAIRASDDGLRIIPACAGKPRAGRRTSPRAWDYPRVCGEAFTLHAQLQNLKGLSPRVRGSRVVVEASVMPGGIIPACAGKPDPGSPASPRAQDYPRVCGEALHRANLQSRIKGLSPRVRGSPPLRLPQQAASRIIPACAGKPRSR